MVMQRGIPPSSLATVQVTKMVFTSQIGYMRKFGGLQCFIICSAAELSPWKKVN
ncbi:hypothetical protein DPMN_168572 [Dreissena polymorpha]|uniref:Uncharacterized protein n=1 Tax=Dreissena polymorpha TaxID=45954 RepID=A0A9D4F274_DREPO|nr:hypothetical protein DPMN_168572 [Dreissena polymorpha]